MWYSLFCYSILSSQYWIYSKGTNQKPVNDQGKELGLYWWLLFAETKNERRYYNTNSKVWVLMADHKQEWQKWYDFYSKQDNEQLQFRAKCIKELLDQTNKQEISFIK